MLASIANVKWNALKRFVRMLQHAPTIASIHKRIRVSIGAGRSMLEHIGVMQTMKIRKR